METGRSLRGLVFMMMLVPWFCAECQTTAVGAASIAMAGISTVQEDAWAIANNPAGLGRYEHVSLATSLEQRYLMKELGYYAVAVTIPVAKGCFGAFTMYSGYQSFIDQKLCLGYGHLFGENVIAGMGLVYVFQKAGSESWPVHQFSYKLGTIVVLSDKVKLAFATFNPFQLSYKSKSFATLPSVFNMGLSYRYSPGLIINTECEKDLEYPPIFKIGLEYNLREIFYIRGGIRMFPASWSFGAAVRQKRLLFEFASSFHQYLGFTPQLSFQYDLK